MGHLFLVERLSSSRSITNSVHAYTVVSHKYARPFATLALVLSAGLGGGAYTGGATFSLVITPSLDQEMLSGSVDAGFVLVLPFYHGDLEPV